MKTEQQLDELISALSKERTPDRDLWPDLQQALQNTPQDAVQNTAQAAEKETSKVIPLRRPQWMKWSALGGIAASVFAAVLLLPQLNSMNNPLPVDEGVTASVAEPLTEESGEWLNTAVSSRVAVLDDMLPKLDQLQRIPDGFDNWQQQLAIWNNASEQLEQALSLQPNNRLLQRQYQTLQRQNAQYLQRLLILSQA